MTLLKIAQIGHPVLRQVAAPISDPRAPEVAALARDMIETMLDAPGVGLAAPQVYRPWRIIVFHVPAARQGEGEPPGPSRPVVLVNPDIAPVSDAIVEGIEGCLSIPALRGRVPRWQSIWFRGLDLSGEVIEGRADGFHARVIQHEVDHLDGILFLDRVTGSDALAAEGEVHHIMPDTEPDTISGGDHAATAPPADEAP